MPQLDQASRFGTGAIMSIVLRPNSLREFAAVGRLEAALENGPTQKVTVGCLIAVAAMSGARSAGASVAAGYGRGADCSAETAGCQAIAGT